MSNCKNIILYHAYGSSALYRQVIFSLLTLYHHLQGNFDKVQIVIYTDDKERFKKYAGSMPIAFEPLTPDRLQLYQGSHNFVHRVKICIIQDCLTKYNGNVLYLDSDTYFLKSPLSLLERIDPNHSIMNTDDYDLEQADEQFENEDWLFIRRAIRDHEYFIAGKRAKIPLTTRMWNAGVIGLSAQNREVLNQVLDLTDQIYAKKKVFTAEQFAFSYFLQHQTTLASSGDVILHYWPSFRGGNWKRIYNQQFNKFFRKYSKVSVAQQAFEAYQLTLQHAQLVRPPKMTLIRRILRRLDLIREIVFYGKLSK